MTVSKGRQIYDDKGRLIQMNVIDLLLMTDSRSRYSLAIFSRTEWRT